jgi:hypothetical protein
MILLQNSLICSINKDPKKQGYKSKDGPESEIKAEIRNSETEIRNVLTIRNSEIRN